MLASYQVNWFTRVIRHLFVLQSSHAPKCRSRPDSEVSVKQGKFEFEPSIRIISVSTPRVFAKPSDVQSHSRSISNKGAESNIKRVKSPCGCACMAKFPVSLCLVAMWSAEVLTIARYCVVWVCTNRMRLVSIGHSVFTKSRA